MVNRVNMLLDKINSFQADTLLESEVYTALNMAQDAFVKSRYGRANKYGKGFDESQKRIDDLNAIIKDYSALPDSFEDLGNGFYRDTLHATMPGHYMHLVSLRVNLKHVGCKYPLEQDVHWVSQDHNFSITGETVTLTRRIEAVEEYEIIDTYDDAEPPVLISSEQGGLIAAASPIPLSTKEAVLCKFTQNDDIFTMLKDPFNTTKISGPLYTISGQSNGEASANSITKAKLEIYTDNTFIVDRVLLRYLRNPRVISGTYNCELAKHTHQEIVNMAVDILLEGISDPRYKSHQMETMKSD